MAFLGIYREPEFSPGRHRTNDVLMLRLVRDVLERLCVDCDLGSLSVARERWSDAELVFSMCQEPDALYELASWQEQGALILNDPHAARRTYRETLCSKPYSAELRFPRSELVPTDGIGTR